DRLTVVAYFDHHQLISKDDVVKYFAQKNDSVLIFIQSSLSCHLSENGHKEDKRWLESNPTALSAKRARIVTRPDVAAALFKWVKHVEEKGKHVSGAMLMTKHETFEEALNVPKEERLRTGGWINNYCAGKFNLKEHHRHGEAGSVDLEAVTRERERIKKLYAEYPPEDNLNSNESGLFGL
ncbi:hypothetical protein BS17DRAFT_714965, partial [Gyrodon lividus]